jgi:hypothetical protein
MNFENLEQMRYEQTKITMESMAKIANDEKVDVKDRIEAAKVVDTMSDSIIKAYLMSDMSKGLNDAVKGSTKDMMKGIEKLIDD